MKMKMLALLMAAVLATCATAAPDAGSLPPIVRSGLAKYKADGAQAAVNAWMIGSPIALSEEPQRQVHTLRAIEGQYGAYQDIHVVRIVTVSPTTQMIYLQLDYANGPAFGKFLSYQARESWNIVSFYFGTDPEVVYGLNLFGAPDMQ
jgi:hypothetical protein